uniref:Uncharacterized protein n=1 Tax=Setaria digitata TaxID=48799 RepID=A0A915PM01_9BILA
MANTNTEASRSSETSSTVHQHPSTSLERRRRLHADQRAQLMYRRIATEKEAEKKRRLLEREKRQKKLQDNTESYTRLFSLWFDSNSIGGFMKDGKTKSPKPNEFHYRCNYLYKAATLLSSQSSNENGLETLSRLYLHEMKELCLVEMIRLEKDFARTICKRCKNVFVARLDGTQSIAVRFALCGSYSVFVLLYELKNVPKRISAKTRPEVTVGELRL